MSRTRLEPVPGEPAAVATMETVARGDRRRGTDEVTARDDRGQDTGEGTTDQRALVIADYHAGIETGLRLERGVDVPSRGPERRDRLLELLERTGTSSLVVLGDLMHAIGDPGGAERGELEVLFESLPANTTVTLVRGNHDGAIESWLGDGSGFDPTVGHAASTTAKTPSGTTEDEGDGHIEATIGGTTVRITDGSGYRLGGLGCCHGHTWPAPAVLEADLVCLGHDHPCVRLEDEVGGARVERVWLRGRLDPAPFLERGGYEGVSWLEAPEAAPRVVVVPAFNNLAGGCWVNRDQSFLTPFLPDGLADGEAYLLDGTRLGAYESV